MIDSVRQPSRRFLLVVVTSVFGLTTLLAPTWQKVRAVDTSSTAYLNGKYYNALANDNDFVAINSMSTGDIQNFLNSKGGFLKDYSENGRSAAQIIYDAAHGHGEASGSLNGIDINTSTGTISPKVILVTLQKEQSLITITTLDQNRLNKAMGYGCPDSGGCNPTYQGFTNQVEWAAWQFRYNYEIAGQSASWWQSHYSAPYYYVGNTVSLGWAGTYYPVTFSNKATAALMRYTPHVGFGNYNFWQLGINWFGFSLGNGGGTPVGDDTDSISSATYKTTIKVNGWKTTDVTAYFEGSKIADTGSTSWSVSFQPQLGSKDYYVSYRDSGGNEVTSKRISIDRHKPGDIDGNGRVDLLDLSQMSSAWGQTVKDDASTNLNPDSDNVVDLLDISIFASNWTG